MPSARTLALPLMAIVACSSTPSAPTVHDASDGAPPNNARNGLVAVPLTGCPLNSYFAPVTIAGQSFTVILDTGSSDVAVALSTCSTCGVESTLSPPAGTCAAELDTQKLLGWVGGVCSETMTVGDEAPSISVDIVGISDNVEFFTAVDCTQAPIPGGVPQYQGILGMGPLPLSTIGSATSDGYMSALAAHGVADTFAMLLCSVGGKLWFGGYDEQYASGAAVYTPLRSTPLGWEITVASIGLGPSSLGAGAASTIVDTGTQYYSVPSDVYSALMGSESQALTTAFGASTLASVFAHAACVTPKGAESQAAIDQALPAMTLTLPSTSGGSFTLRVPATRSYLIPATPAAGGATEYCIALKDSATTDGYALLGGPLLRANITVFDLGHAALGFVPQTACE